MRYFCRASGWGQHKKIKKEGGRAILASRKSQLKILQLQTEFSVENCKKTVKSVLRVQKRDKRKTRGLENVIYGEKMNLFSLVREGVIKRHTSL